MPDSNQSLNLNKRAENDEALAKAEEELTKELSGEETPEQPKQPEGEQEAPQTEDKPAVPQEETPPSEPESEEVALSQYSAKGQERIKVLADKASQVPDLEKKIQELEALVARTKSPAPAGFLEDTPKKVESKLPWDNQEDHELTMEEYERDVEEKAKKAAREEFERQTIADNLQTDAMLAEQKYPEFRKPTEEAPNSNFDQELVDFTWKIFSNELKSNRSVRLGEIINRVMSIKRKAADEARKSLQTIVNKQETEQAIDPSGTPQVSPANDNIEGKINSARSMKELAELERLIPVG